MKENKIKKVSIFGAGYVGCALAGQSAANIKLIYMILIQKN